MIIFLMLLVLPATRSACTTDIADYPFRHYQFGTAAALGQGTILVKDNTDSRMIAVYSYKLTIIKFAADGPLDSST